VVAGGTAWCSIGLKKSQPPAQDVIEIPSFPYSDTRNTNNSTRDQFDNYSCSPATNEKGSEYVYTFEVGQSGKFTATISDGSGVDIDIYLLSSLDSSACIARHDSTISISVNDGRYYLVADTYSNSSGTQYPGQYTLAVDFKPDSPPQEIIEIASFPYSDTRDTKNSTRDQFDNYSCAPSAGEKGPEYVYAFEVSESGKITATISDGGSADIDIHLLSALDVNACLARNNTTISLDINAGRYYLVADTYSNSSETAYPGQYTLNADFVSSGGTSDIQPPTLPPVSSTETNWTCSSTAGTKRNAAGSYYVTSFGCWIDDDGNPQGDPGDNCIPWCLSGAAGQGRDAAFKELCNGLSGPDCERSVQWYAADADRFGCAGRLLLENPINGKKAVVAVIDRGPSCTIENRVSYWVLDLSYPATAYLFGGEMAATEKGEVKVTEVSETTPLGPWTK
jgi:hypothetical protein